MASSAYLDQGASSSVTFLHSSAGTHLTKPCDPDDHKQEVRNHPGGLAVEAIGLVKTFETVRAVDGIDLEVHQGEVLGVLGPNGAGKTTMLKMLATVLPIDGGTARIFGVDVAANPHQVRQLVGVTGQYASVSSTDP